MSVSPSMTFNAQAGALASQSLAASGTVTYNLDLSNKFEGQIQVKDTGGGTVAATNGCQIDVYRGFGAGPTYDTTSMMTIVITTVVSTAKYASFSLPTGKYQVKLTNLDATNAITVESTLSTVDSVG
jgi:hypothetical protein